MKLEVNLMDGAADRDLERRVTNYLAERFRPSLRRLEVEARGGAVTLRGSVHSFYEKQVAIHSCRRVAGVRELIDAVDVTLDEAEAAIAAGLD
jgi:osmotically-inducible protein OsmY